MPGTLLSALTAALLAMLLLGACGNKGALYLPDTEAEPAVSTAPPLADDEEEERADTRGAPGPG